MALVRPAPRASSGLLVQVEAGVDNEALITGRAIHEASQIVFAFRSGEADELVHLWLEDEGRHGYVKQKPARDAQDRFAASLEEAMKRRGMNTIAPVRHLVEELYDQMSRTAHSRRSSCVIRLGGWAPDVVRDPPLPTQARRCGAMGGIDDGRVTISAGDALAAFFEPDSFSREIRPIQQSIAAVGNSSPLDQTEIQRQAGTAD